MLSADPWWLGWVAEELGLDNKERRRTMTEPATMMVCGTCAGAGWLYRYAHFWPLPRRGIRLPCPSCRGLKRIPDWLLPKPPPTPEPEEGRVLHGDPRLWVPRPRQPSLLSGDSLIRLDAINDPSPNREQETEEVMRCPGRARRNKAPRRRGRRSRKR